MSDDIFDFAIVGAGMAGASLAAELADDARVLLLEGEEAPGYHATGRSAAFWEECYGGPDVVGLTQASGPYLREGGYLRTRGALYIAQEGCSASLSDFAQRFHETGVAIQQVNRARLKALVPGLRPEWSVGIEQPACADIDVARLHADYLAKAKRAGSTLVCKAQVADATYRDGVWDIDCLDGRAFRAATLVNAAGAWSDTVARMAGVRPVGIRPLLRTVIQLRVDPTPPDSLPLVIDLDGAFYFKPQSGRLWLSPHDETPSLPTDAAPDEWAIAQAVDRLQQVTDWRVEAVERKWAGLRSFAPDRLPVYGADPAQPGFIWFAGQGGFGIQTAPAAAQLMADSLLGRPQRPALAKIDKTLYAASRFT